MTYQDFTKTYFHTLKKYPRLHSIFTDKENKVICNLEKVEYAKNGSRWMETGRTKKNVDFIHVINIIDAIPFFRNLGGREIVKQGYTPFGYIPNEIHSISPSGEQKSVYKFHYIYN